MSILSFTREEALKKTDQYKELFTVVRILDDQTLLDICNGKKPTGIDHLCPCYSFWDRDENCSNCISLRAFQEKKEISKFEFKESNNDVYYVIAQYLEIDGKPSVIEYVKKLGDDPFIDSEGRSRFIEKLFNFEDILYTDALTGVYNRRYYEDKIKMSLDIPSVAIIDIDDFKLYNDRFGHYVGDLVLKTVAQEIKSCLEKSEKIIRFGGDEFLLLINTSQHKILANKIQLIKEYLSKITVPDYPKLRITVSIGAAICRNNTVEESLERADRLMYYAKATKNHFFIEGENVKNDFSNLRCKKQRRIAGTSKRQHHNRKKSRSKRKLEPRPKHIAGSGCHMPVNMLL